MYEDKPVNEPIQKSEVEISMTPSSSKVEAKIP